MPAKRKGKAMATKLDDISLAIGRLQEQLAAHERGRIERNASVDRKFDQLSGKVGEVETKVDAVVASIDAKVEKASRKYIGGAVGGALIVAAQYAASSLGLKFPHLG